MRLSISQRSIRSPRLLAQVFWGELGRERQRYVKLRFSSKSSAILRRDIAEIAEKRAKSY